MHNTFLSAEAPMRKLFTLVTLAALIVVSAKAEADFQSLTHLFDYDAKQPLDLQDKIIAEFADGTLHDITYTSPKGGPVDAYLVVPKGKGPFAAILFGHWGNGTRAEFIPEAKIYAKAGAVSLLPDYPWDRSQPWYKSLDHTDKPELDRDIEIQAVIDLRRGIDLLLARPDVDPERLAYVGHSYGAQWGSILSAVDKRMKTSILVAGVAELETSCCAAPIPAQSIFGRLNLPASLKNILTWLVKSTRSISSDMRRRFRCCSNLRITNSTLIRRRCRTTSARPVNRRRCFTMTLATM